MACDPVWHSHACGGISGGNLFYSCNVSDWKSDFWHDGAVEVSYVINPWKIFLLYPGIIFPYDASGIGNHGIADPDN